MEKKEINNSIIKKILVLLIILIFAGNASAQEFPAFENKYVNDFAHIFNDTEVQQLRVLLAEVEQNTTAQVVIVTIPSLNGSDISQYATDLGQNWGVGNKDNDNGLLILYAADNPATKRLFVATGYGLEGILPDSKIGRMLDEYYVPYRNNGNFSQGIIIFTQEISKVIRQNSGEVSSGTGIINYIPDFLPFIIFVIIFILLGLMSKRKRKKCSKDGLMMKYIGLAGGYYLYKCANGHIHKELKSSHNNAVFFGSGAGGFGGGGFSGGGFGGGGFGGGGAGR